MPVSSIFGNEDGAAPLLISLVVAAVIGLLLQSVGQHKAHPFVAILVDNAFGAVSAEMHPIKALADGQLYGPGAGTVGAEVSTPQLQLAPFPSLFGRVGYSASLGSIDNVSFLQKLRQCRRAASTQHEQGANVFRYLRHIVHVLSQSPAQGILHASCSTPSSSTEA